MTAAPEASSRKVAGRGEAVLAAGIVAAATRLGQAAKLDNAVPIRVAHERVTVHDLRL